MRNDKRVPKLSVHIWIKRAVGILICVAFCGVIASAQKRSNDNAEGVTLADLGVTETQKTELEMLWKLKRQKQIQAVEDLKTLNRLAKDTLAEDTDIQETLVEFRTKRKAAQQKIEKIEEGLLQTLPIRAQLHLTLLGVLDNGIPPRIPKSQTDKKTDGTSQERK